MKARNGFVSNSSSTSFVVAKDAYETVADVALAMIPAREWETDDKLMATFRKLTTAQKNHPLAFRSCNYDTFISESNGKYYIFTCNNHPFYEELEGIVREASEGCDSYWELSDTIKNGIMYFWPEYNTYAQPIEYSELRKKKIEWFCCEDKCYMDIMRAMNGDIFCPKCKKVYWKNEN